jgi:hypothetical protein
MGSISFVTVKCFYLQVLCKCYLVLTCVGFPSFFEIKNVRSRMGLLNGSDGLIPPVQDLSLLGMSISESTFSSE